MPPRNANGQRVFTLGQVVLALAILLGLVGGALAVTDRFATASALADVVKRLDRIEASVERLRDAIAPLPGDGRRGAP